MHIIPFAIVPQLLDMLLLICHSVFSLHFSLEGFYWQIFKFILFLVMSHLLLSLPKAFISITEFLISSISIWFPLISSSLLMLPVYSSILSTFPISSLSILIIVILNSMSDNSKCHAISESVSDVCFVSDALDNQIEVNRPLVWDLTFIWL